MRLLYLPLSTNKNLNGDSSYNIAKKFVANAVRHGWFVHWVLPEVEGESRFNYRGERSEMESHPHVMVHRVPVIEDQYIQTGFVPSEYLYRNFSQHEGKYHIDAVLTERPGSALYVRKLLQHPFVREASALGKSVGKVPLLPVFVRDPFTKSRELHNISQEEELAETLGYATCHNVFYSQNDVDIATGVAKKYLNFAQVKKMLERSVVIPSGTDTTELDKIKGTIEKRDQYTVLIAERLKNGAMMDILDAVDYMFKRGYDIRVAISSQTPFNPFTLANYPTLFEHAELHPSNPREMYLPLAMSCHATITMPETHSYPQGLMEQLYLGLVAVLPDYKWVDYILPGYPFKVPRHMPDMVAMLKWIGENYEEACQKVAWVPEHIRKNYNSTKMSDKLLEHIESTTERIIEGSTVSPGMVDVLNGIKRSHLTEQDLYAFMQEATRNGLDFDNVKKTAAFGNYKSMLFRVMKSMGWVDRCDSPYVHFERKVKR